MYRGLAHEVLGDNEKALKDYTESIRLDDFDPNAYYLRGSIQVTLGAYETALKDLSKSIDINPDNPDGFAVRAMAYAYLGNTSESERDAVTAKTLGFDENILDQLLDGIQISR
jgi:tetratricopeptide (TPR) repeat protein